MDEVQRLKDEGKSVREIAALTGKSPSAVFRALAKQKGTVEQSEEPIGNGHAEAAPVADRLTADEVQKRVRIACASEDPDLILPMLDKLRQRHERLADLLARERSNKATAEKNIQTLAVQFAESDNDPVLEHKLSQNRTDLVSATSLIAAVEREFGVLGRLVAELDEAAEKRQSSQAEHEQNTLLMNAHNVILAAQREFFRKMDEATAHLRSAEAVGKAWNGKSRSFKLPESFGTRNIENMKDVCSKITAISAKGEPVGSIKVRLGKNFSFQEWHGGDVVLMPAFQARHMVEEHPEYQCSYVETIEQ